MDYDVVAHQCPFCELRFALMAEVKDHILHDHPKRAAGIENVRTPENPRG